MLLDLSESEKERRIRLCYEPYHQALARINKEENPDLILSIHSYTPCYEGQKRKVEIGVLFNDDEQLAHKFNDLFLKANYDSRLNEPWSGKEGLMFSADHHSKRTFEQLYDTDAKRRKPCSAIMLEMRQDLLVDPVWRRRVIELIEGLLKRRDVEQLILEKTTM